MLINLGFGDWLHSIDPSRNWDEHLEHILIFCKVHVLRNFLKRFPKHNARSWIHECLWQSQSRLELEKNMDSICSAYPELTNWVNNKRKPWIIAGLCHEVSKIPPEWRSKAPKETGLGESSHFADNNYSGRKNTKVGSVLK